MVDEADAGSDDGADSAAVVEVDWCVSCATPNVLQTQVPLGATVLFSITDSAPHSFIADSGATFSTAQFRQSDNTKATVGDKTGAWAWKPTKLGKVEYHCGVHPSMKGTCESRVLFRLALRFPVWQFEIVG